MNKTLQKWMPKITTSSKKRKRAVIYDFDGTLFMSPDRETGEISYFEGTGQEWPFSGWWGRNETLMPPIVPDPIPESMWITTTVEAYRTDRVCPQTNVYLMTGRPAKMRKRVEEILNSNNITFDEYYYRGMKGYPQHGDTLEIKLNLIKTQVIHPELEILEIWEDRPEHTSRFCHEAKNKFSSDSGLKKVIVHDVLTGTHNEF